MEGIQMKKAIMAFIVVVLLMAQLLSVAAMDAGDAKQEWLSAKQHTQDMQWLHRDAKVAFADDPSDENRADVVASGKKLMDAALDEAEAWLIWKRLEAQENPLVPEDIKESIEQDVESNLETIEELRADVDAVQNQAQMGVVFLKMVGKYAELLTDVARNSGKLWVHIGNTHADTIEAYEEKLRAVAEDEHAIGLLDDAHDELETARENLDKAEDTYMKVKIPGTPFIKFAEGNNYLRAAKANLMAAHKYLNQAYMAMR
jgi:hypothetical protein